MRALALCPLLLLAACASQEDLRNRHGSPLHTFACANGKSFQQRQLMTGEVEVTAGGVTADVRDADGDPIQGGWVMETAGDFTTLHGAPGGPYERCTLDDALTG